MDENLNMLYISLLKRNGKIIKQPQSNNDYHCAIEYEQICYWFPYGAIPKKIVRARTAQITLRPREE